MFLDMMNNFRELAETQLQCVVCSEVLVEATALSCGHTFCRHCITVWKAKSATCPVCRADIRHMAPCKVMDEYTDKLYEQFISDGGQAARQRQGTAQGPQEETADHHVVIALFLSATTGRAAEAANSSTQR